MESKDTPLFLTSPSYYLKICTMGYEIRKGELTGLIDRHKMLKGGNKRRSA
jgi:hypothetical protein